MLIRSIAGLRPDVLELPILHNTAYGYSDLPNQNSSLRDEMWGARINLDRLEVVVDLDFIKRQNLHEGEVFPWDPSKRVYVVTAYHQLHCLVSFSLK